MATELKDTATIISAAAILSYSYYYSGDMEKALNILHEIADIFCSDGIPSDFNVPLSRIYLDLGQIDSARFYAEAELMRYEEDDVPSGVYGLLYKVEAADGNLEKANAYLIEFIDHDFSENLMRKEQSVHEADMRYKNNELRRIIYEREQHVRYTTVICSLVVIALLGIIAAIVQTRKRKLNEKDAEISEYKNKMSTIQEYCSRLEFIRDSVQDMNYPVEEHLQVLKELMEILVHSQSDMKAAVYARFKELTIKEESGMSAMLEMFVYSFDMKYPGVKGLLAARYPELNSNDINLYILIGLGCSTAVIAYMLRTSESYIYNRRMVLRKRLCLSEDRRAFASHLSELSRLAGQKHS